MRGLRRLCSSVLSTARYSENAAKTSDSCSLYRSLFSTVAVSSTSVARTAARHHPQHLGATAKSLTWYRAEWSRQFGFAARSTLIPKPKGSPVGLAGSSLARRTAATIRQKSSLASSAASATHSYSPSSLSSGLSQGWRRALAWWLGGCSAWVFALVIIGGVTRLTRSGLSMTEWKFTGERPPQTEMEWGAEFARYKMSPEFKRVNSTMTVEEFKFIFWVEWGHRMWGRALGLLFALPAAVFAAKGAVNGPLARRLSLLLLMGGTQGLVGWWMVRSGLQEPVGNEVPRVSPYRLAAHLVSAFAIYATLVWTTLSLAIPLPPSVTSGPSAGRAASLLFRASLPISALIAVTAASGAFVAGLDAGHAYNTFPDMNGEWIPEEYWDMAGWRNAFENTAAVQLHHRVLALTTLAACVGLWRYGTRLPDLPATSRLLLHGLAAGAAAQVTLGVATLLNYVPVTLGSAHQAGALTLFTIVLGLLYSTRPAPGLAPYRMARLLTPAAAAAVMGVGGAVVQLQ